MQRGVDECSSSGWERLTDPAFIVIDRFQLRRQSQQLALQLTGHAGSQFVTLTRWIESVNL